MDTTTLVTAVNQILHDAGAGVWHPTGPAYTSAQTGIFYGPIGAAPDKAIGVTSYNQTDDVVNGEAIRYIQVKCRGAKGAPNGADVIADAAKDALHGVYHTSGFARISRNSAAPLGADENGRQERVDNYQILLDNPEA